MSYTEASKRSAMKYMKEHLDDVRLRVPKGTKESWKKYAEKQGLSMTRFVLNTINEVIESDKADKGIIE